MRAKKAKRKVFLGILTVLFITAIVQIMNASQSSVVSRSSESQHNLSLMQSSFIDDLFIRERESQIVTDSGFKDSDNWESIGDGDLSDLNARVTEGYGQFIVNGEQGTFIAHSGQINNDSAPYWYNSTNPDIPVPPTKNQTITDLGLYASHLWDEHKYTTVNPYQRAAAQWDKLINAPKNLSDYYIIDASLQVRVNASVRSYPGNGDDETGGWGGVEALGDTVERGINEGDYIRYYVQLSNPDKSVSYRAAEYQPEGLGDDGLEIIESWDNLTDTIFNSTDKEDLIFFLNQVLQSDFKTFYLTLGVEFYSEDNQITDLDYFEHIYIKECDFNFTYQKKINRDSRAGLQFSGIALDNEGGRIEILAATMNFDLNINNSWNTGLSPNSEMLIRINERTHTESIRLGQLSIDLEQADEEGFNILTLVGSNENIVGVSLLMADEFGLSESYLISIDNVHLTIRYRIYLTAEQNLLYQSLIGLAGLVALGLVGYLVYYQRVLKYPKPVRKVRKYKKSLLKSSQIKVEVNERENQIAQQYSSKVKKYQKPVKSKPKSLERSIDKVRKSKEKVIPLLLIIALLGLNLFGLFPLFINHNIYTNEQKIESRELMIMQSDPGSDLFREFREEQWIKNSEFETSEGWERSLNGDLNDFDSRIDNGVLQTSLLGEQGMLLWNETDPVSTGGWSLLTNENGIPRTDGYTMSSLGWNVTHYYPDNAPQLLISQWSKNFSTGIDMSDYIITAASLSAWINGSVVGRDVEDGGIDRPGDTYSSGTSTIDIATGDYARYFIYISDIEKNREIQAAYYQTDDLGRDIEPDSAIEELNDTIIAPINEESLIFYLNEVLKYDNYNFTLTVGFSIWCEDSGQPGDSDDWENLWIKNLTLSLSYEKKIDQLSTISWEYEGNQIDNEGKIVELNAAFLNFKYRLSDEVLTALTPNSEFRMFINDVEHSETAPITGAGTSMGAASENGFEVSDLIPKDENIRLTLELIMADEFQLDRTIDIDVDDVQLTISYYLITPAENLVVYQAVLIVALIGIAGISVYIVYYRKVLRFPKQVRLVRKFKKSLRKGKTPPESIQKRDEAIMADYSLKYLINSTNSFKNQ